MDLIGNLAASLAALFAVLSHGSIAAATVGLSLSYAMIVTGSLNWLVRVTSDLEQNMVGVERIAEYSEVKQVRFVITLKLRRDCAFSLRCYSGARE